MRPLTSHALLACVLALALVPAGCFGVQTQKGEPESEPSSLTTQPPPGSEVVQPPAGEEASGGEQPGGRPATPAP